MYASTFGNNIIFEPGSTQFQPPTTSQLSPFLQNKYSICTAINKANALFSALFCGNIPISNYDLLIVDIASSWTSIFSSSSQLKINIQGQQEYISIPG